MIICTDEAIEALKDLLKDSVSDTDINLPVDSLWHIRVYTLPDAAFEGLETDDGEPAQILYIDLDIKDRIVKAWKDLVAGRVTLLEIGLVLTGRTRFVIRPYIGNSLLEIANK